ncbi:MAG: endonuclease/exonuclease/phosphatase family protein [Planctomycetota bacterium]
MRTIAVLFSLLVCFCSMLGAQEDQRLSTEQSEVRIMTFNLWVGGVRGGQPIEQSAQAIRSAKADVVGLQETNVGSQNNGAKLAEILGWHYLDQGGRTGILSKFPILEPSKNKWGAKIDLPGKTDLMMFNIHLAPAPYQPYQLLEIPYGSYPFIKSEKETIEWAEKARGGQLDRLIADMQPALKSNLPIAVTGDFNEPSFQDWTVAAVQAELCPIKVKYPSTFRVSQLGLVDTWRVCYPDEVTHPGWTWTPLTSPKDPKDKHDRIDFVFASDQWFTVKSCSRVAEKGNSEITLEPWPSDHRAVVVCLKMKVKPESTESGCTNHPE